GFSPDSDYPLINAEKGLIQINLSIKEKSDLLVKGGGALNSVPDSCTYEGPQIDELLNLADSLSYKVNSSDNSLEVIGKAVHSAKVYEGINAIGRMAILLDKQNITSPILKFMANEIGEDSHGENIFGTYEDDVSGKITVNMAKVDIRDGKQELYIDIR